MFGWRDNLFIFYNCRDSDDEAEGKNKFVEILNEVETEEKGEVSGENKAAQVLEKVFTQGEEEEAVEEGEVEPQMETEESETPSS